MEESIPRDTREFEAWVPFVRNLVRQIHYKHAPGQRDDDLVQDILTALLTSRIVERFWQRAHGEEETILTISEAAVFLGLNSPDAFRVRMWRNRKIHPNRRLKVCDEKGVQYATRCARGRRAYFRLSDLVRWQVDFYPKDRVTFVEGAGIKVRVETTITEDPDVSQWRGYLKRAVANHMKNVYRWRGRHHKDRPASNFSEFLSAEGVCIFEETISHQDTPEAIMVAAENVRAREGFLDLIRLKEKRTVRQRLRQKQSWG
jgi:hypothetical protein